MKKKKYIITLILIMFISLVCSCADNININNNKVLEKESIDSINDEIVQKESEVKPKFKNTYKMFYGKWEIKNILGYDNKLGETLPEFNLNIGKTIFYGNDKIEYDDLTLENFLYSYTILPNEKDNCYFYNTLTNEQLGISGEYYVFVHVETLTEELGANSPDFIGDEFFIIDDNTLVLVKNGVFYLAKRQTHIYKDDIEKKVLNTHI